MPLSMPAHRPPCRAHRLLLVALALQCVLSEGMALQDDVLDGAALWGTYRPQALMSVRARRPHSPAFGFMYHGASSNDVRHLASDHEGKIKSYGFLRHDGASFADHEVVDDELNVRLSFSFVKHHESDHAWAMRISGEVVDAENASDDLSVVFYGFAGPEEVKRTGISSDNGRETPWGTITVSDANVRREDGYAGDVTLDGYSGSIGGAYRVVVKEPLGGNMSPEAMRDLSVTSSVSKRRRRARRFTSDQRASAAKKAFHVAGPHVSESKAFLVEEVLQLLLKEAENRQYNEADLDVMGSDVDDDDDDDEWVESTSNSMRSGGRNQPVVLEDDVDGASPMVFVQRILNVPFEMDVLFASAEDPKADEADASSALLNSLTPTTIDGLLSNRRLAFDSKFERVFGFRKRGYEPLDIQLGRSTVANVLGGIGYFYGGTVLDGASSGHMYRMPAGLLTATPSRGLFPRGFMWDEGFHQLLVQRWDEDLSKSCLASWLDMMDDSGWIPREQVLGLEARHRFPSHVKHLMVQNRLIANPPTLLLPLRHMISSRNASKNAGEKDGSVEKSEVGRCGPPGSGPLDELESECANKDQSDADTHRFGYPYLEKSLAYFRWLVRSQSGEEDGSFRWQGRSEKLRSPDGYPLTLASGLDDYPRGRLIKRYERHLDLHCWIAWACRTVADFHRASGVDAKPFDSYFEKLLRLLDKYHGPEDDHVNKSEDRSQLADDAGTGELERAEQLKSQLLCDYDGRKHACEVGYVTVLPLALGLLEPSSPRIGAILETLEDWDQLRSVGGVRSLSKASEFYRKGNDYWTGSVWMPFNYLILASLKSKYGTEDGPYRERAAELYDSLKRDIIANVRSVYNKTGLLWENYDPDNGAGKSGRQFTGWTALIVLIYGDMYDGIQ